MTGWLRKHVFGVDDAQEAAAAATQSTIEGQEKALQYLQETSELPLEMRDEALRGLGNYYKVPQDKTQDEIIAEARNSPLYSAIMGTQQAGEEAVGRWHSAMGGLRSGGGKADIYKHTQQLEKDALLTAFNETQGRQDLDRLLNLQGLTGLAGLSGNENSIAGLMAGIGQTRGQGQLAHGQIRSQGTQNALDTIMGSAQALATVFSDIRLKSDIRFLGTHNGLNYYGWTWNELAKPLGLTGEASGVLAHEVYELYPEAIGEKDGYIQVHYSRLPQEVH